MAETSAANPGLVNPSQADIVATPLPWREAQVGRQIGVIVALAAAIAVGVAAALWSQQPAYTPLFSELPDAEVARVSTALKASNTQFSIDPTSGQVLVPAEQMREIRMNLAAQGLPQSTGALGLEMLQQEQDMTTSQFIEQARYKYAIENELARSISQLRNVKSARVHLALPKETIFVRERTPPSASVVLNLHGGRRLEEGQVAAIVHLVSSSVPHMDASQVTIVDQMGSLLTTDGTDPGVAQSSSQYNYTRRLEANYQDRIKNLLEPIVGLGKVRAQITASVNFTHEELSREAYDPASKVLRSEQVQESDSGAPSAAALGVPGVLSNQPPGAGTTQEPDAEGNANATQSSASGSQSRAATRNYEVDKTLSYKRNASSDIERLAIAVVIDDKQMAAAAEGAEAGADAASGKQPYTDEELARFTALVKEAIGFDEARGDSINLINQSFLEQTVEPLPDLAIWEQPWFLPLIKQILAGVFVLLLLLLIIRPTLKALLSPPVRVTQVNNALEGGVSPESRAIEGVAYAGETKELEFDGEGNLIDPDEEQRQKALDNNLRYARELIEQDPARAANLLKEWLG